MSFKQLKTNPHRSECSVCKDKAFVLCQCETPQTKPLSDEEIISCVNKEFDLELKADNATVLAFARAILRKAQEK